VLEKEGALHREHVVTTTVHEVSSKFKELEAKVEKKKRDAAAINSEMDTHTSYRTDKTGKQKPSKKTPPEPAPIVNSERDRKTVEFNQDAVNEVIRLRTFIRKQKVLTMMKQVLTQEMHEKDLANQKAQLTSNAALWD
jgi:hypothetical protein